MTTNSNSRKVLIPLATLLAAGAVAIGSGATWTSTTTSSVSVTAGTLLHENDSDGATLTISDMKPGDSMTGTVEIENTGSLDSTLEFTDDNVSSTFDASGLTLVITQDGTEVYNGDFGALTGPWDGGDLDAADPDALPLPLAADTTTFVFTVSMPVGAGNGNQGETASADYSWVTTQEAGGTLTTLWN